MTSGRRLPPVALLTALLSGPALAQTTPATIAGLPPQATAGRGAALPFVEHEAENAVTTGVVVGPDRTFGAMAAEASGRRAVRLEAPGQSVTFVIGAPANAVTVRYATPDAGECRSGDAVIGLYVDDRRLADVPLTPCYSWFYGAYPFTNRAEDGGGHHSYDHARLLLDGTLPAGAQVALRFEAQTAAPWVVVDLVDFEQAPPAAPAPTGSLSVIDFGADASGQVSSRAAFQAALDAGRLAKRPVWIPPGQYRIDGHLLVDEVQLIGAGPWRSVLRGDGVGVYGRKASEGGSRNVRLMDFAIVGEVMDRDDQAQLNGVGGALNHSLIRNLHIQHTKVGLWLDGPLDGLTIQGVRILDQTADGLNFHGGVTRSVVEDSFIRNVGDDGLAMWSHRIPNADNVFRNNTIIAPVLANGVAIYGGRDITVRGNVIADTLTRGGGLHLGARFDATPFEGSITLSGNTVIRSGSIDPVWGFGVGAVWLYALDRPISCAAISIQDTDMIDSTDAAFQLLGERIDGVTVDRAAVTGAASVVQLRARGRLEVRDLAADALTGAAVDDHAPDLELIDGGGNRGWSTDRPERGLFVPSSIEAEPPERPCHD